MKKTYNELVKDLSAIVEEHVEGYQDDFYGYDVDTLKELDPDKTYVWVARQHGTNLSADPEYMDSILKCWEPKKVALITLRHDGNYDVTYMDPVQYKAWSEKQRDYYLNKIRDALHDRTVFDTHEYTPCKMWFDFGYIHVNYYGTVTISDNNEELYNIIKKLHFTAYSFYTYAEKYPDYKAA